MALKIQSRDQKAPLIVSAIFIVVIAVSVSLRVYARFMKKVKLGVDDYCIFAATIFTYGLIACDMIGVAHGGVGLHATTVVMKYGPGPLVVFLKDLVAIQMLWATSLMFVKLSILAFYRRIFPTPLFRRVALFTTVLVALWCLSVILCGFFLCRPFAFNWDQTIKGGKCGDQVKSYIVTGALNICTDVMMLTLPLPIVWKLHAPKANKIALTGIFTLGFFICIISVLRLRALLTVDYSDITHSVVAALIWSMLEPALGIALACAPIIRPLFKIFRNESSAAATNGNSGDLINARSGDAKHFHRLEDSTYALNPMDKHRTDIGTAGSRPSLSKSGARERVDDIESQSNRSESELVPASRIAVKKDWAVRSD